MYDAAVRSGTVPVNDTPNAAGPRVAPTLATTASCTTSGRLRLRPAQLNCRLLRHSANTTTHELIDPDRGFCSRAADPASVWRRSAHHHRHGDSDRYWTAYRATVSGGTLYFVGGGAVVFFFGIDACARTPHGWSDRSRARSPQSSV